MNCESKLSPDPEVDCDFRRALYNTIILLGGRPDIAQMLKKSADYGVTAADLDTLGRYNYELVHETKQKLNALDTIKVQIR
jgi:hypothetical protein